MSASGIWSLWVDDNGSSGSGSGIGDGDTDGGSDGQGDLDLLRDEDGKNDGDGEDDDGKSDGGEDDDGKSDSGGEDDDGNSDGSSGYQVDNGASHHRSMAALQPSGIEISFLGRWEKAGIVGRDRVGGG
ncbi:hypothetical protein Tco_0837764 [Tanacetum coccineum]